MHVVAILNEKSGTAADKSVTESSLRDAFLAAGFEVDLHLLPPDEIEPALKRAIASRPDALFIGGGDGTVSATARLLAGSAIPLAVLPLGTLNHFAKDLGLPTDWKETIIALSRSEIRSVDLAEVNGHIFVNNCSIGAYADAVRQREVLRDERNHSKWRAMIVASLRVFLRLKRLRFRVNLDQHEIDLRSPFLVVANNRYDGNILAQSLRERLDEGRLWIYTTRAHRHFTILRMFWQAIRHELAAADALESRATTEAVVHLPMPSITVAADGEILQLETPLRFRIRPRALKVLVPLRAPQTPAA